MGRIPEAANADHKKFLSEVGVSLKELVGSTRRRFDGDSKRKSEVSSQGRHDDLKNVGVGQKSLRSGNRYPIRKAWFLYATECWMMTGS